MPAMRSIPPLVLVAGLAAACVLPGSALAAKPRHKTKPAPTIVSVAPLRAAWPGGKVPVADVVRAGKARSDPARLVYVLSRDRRRGRGDVQLRGSRRLRALAPKATSSGRTTVAVPRRVKTGAWHLLASVQGLGRARCGAVRLPAVAAVLCRHVWDQPRSDQQAAAPREPRRSSSRARCP